MYDSSGHICGCYFTGPSLKAPHQRHYLPQAELQSHTRITPVCFSTQLKQKFSNPHDQIIKELRYTFPLYDGVSVCAYTIRYGDKALNGVVKQKNEARKTYQEAVDRGETAGLLESLPAGVFGVTIGNLAAQTDVYVDIEYAGELKYDAGIDGLRYNLPTSIAPRFGEYPGELLKSNTIASGISITIDIDMGKSAIRRIQSPTHPIAVTMGNLSTESPSSTFMPSKGSASLTKGTTELGADFVLQLLIDDISRPQAILEKHKTLGTRAIMATLVPKFNLPAASPEIVFIADQSGSMGGAKNMKLVAALQVFLKSLPFGVRFNICAFGSTYTYLWSKSQAYNEDNLKEASEFVNTFRAQWGGTQMHEPVKQAFQRRLGDLPLEIMLLTDGEIWQEQQLFALISEKIHTEKIDARVFTLGIGADVSHTLCEGAARAGNGFAQFVTEDEETDAKILRMLKASLFPHTQDYSLEVNYDDRNDGATDDFEIIEKVENNLRIEDEHESTHQQPAPISFFDQTANSDATEQPADRYAHLPKVAIPKILQAPSRIPPLFPYNRTTLYLVFSQDAPQKNIVSVTLRAQAPSGPLELTIPVYTDDTPGTVVHQLAARKAVQDLEEGRGWIQEGKTVDGLEVKQKYTSRLDELVEREAVRLGETYQIAGKWCSFVAVGAKSGKQVRISTHGTAPDTDMVDQDEDEEDEENYEEAVAAPQTTVRSVFQPAFAGFGAPSPGGDMSRKKRASRGVVTGPFFCRAAKPSSKTTEPTGSFGSKANSAVGGGLFGSSNSIAVGRASFGSPCSNMATGASFAPTSVAGGGTFQAFGGVGQASQGSSLFGYNSAAQPSPTSIGNHKMQEKEPQQGLSYDMLGANVLSGGQISAMESVPQDSASLVRALIDMQAFAGHWQWNDRLLKLIAANDSRTNGLAQNDLSATALVLVFLQQKMAAQHDVWELVAHKAEAWLSAQLSSTEVSKLLADVQSRLS